MRGVRGGPARRGERTRFGRGVFSRDRARAGSGPPWPGGCFEATDGRHGVDNWGGTLSVGESGRSSRLPRPGSIHPSPPRSPHGLPFRLRQRVPRTKPASTKDRRDRETAKRLSFVVRMIRPRRAPYRVFSRSAPAGDTSPIGRSSVACATSSGALRRTLSPLRAGAIDRRQQLVPSRRIGGRCGSWCALA